MYMFFLYYKTIFLYRVWDVLTRYIKMYLHVCSYYITHFFKNNLPGRSQLLVDPVTCILFPCMESYKTFRGEQEIDSNIFYYYTLDEKWVTFRY